MSEGKQPGRTSRPVVPTGELCRRYSESSAEPCRSPSRSPHEHEQRIRPKDATGKEPHAPRSCGRSSAALYNGQRPHSALTARRPIKPTSRRCHSAWQPNRIRSTYRRGKSVQTTGTTSTFIRANPDLPNMPLLRRRAELNLWQERRDKDAERSMSGWGQGQRSR